MRKGRHPYETRNLAGPDPAEPMDPAERSALIGHLDRAVEELRLAVAVAGGDDIGLTASRLGLLERARRERGVREAQLADAGLEPDDHDPERTVATDDDTDAAGGRCD